MRIAMVAACPFPSPQGSQVFIGEMCVRLAERGHRVHLLTYGQGERCAMTGVEHVRIPRLPGDNASRSGPTPVKPILDLMLSVALHRLLGRHRVDVMHCHNYEATVAGLAVRALRRVPVVYHSHNLMGDELPTYFSGAMTRALAAGLGGRLDRYVPRAADAAIALCGYSAEILADLGVARSRISIIPPAIEDPGLARGRAQARRVLGLQPDAAVIAYVGNLDAYQNLSVLVAGFARLAAAHGRRPATLVVATHETDTALTSSLRAAGVCDQALVVRCDGFSTAKKVMDAADVLVLPRRTGSGLPVKLLNYMAAGRPIVTAGCGGKVLEDGVDGVVVRDDDAAALAEGCRRVLDDPEYARRIGEGARRTYLSSLTWEAVLPAIEEVYARVAAGQGRGYVGGAVPV
jgi:glycosyltransferase involved in cell wall biosynthesis